MILFDTISVGYESHNVLAGLNWNIEEGKIHGLVGLNGSGKTTLLHAFYGYVKPSSGKIQRNNNSIHRNVIGLLETQNYFYPLITGREYLSIFPQGNRPFSLENWNKLFSLPLDDLIETYSTGMKKKLALLGVFKMDKEIYLLDEPYNGLDLESTTVLKLILDELRKSGKTVIITSHVYESLESVCDCIHHLDNGKIQMSYDKSSFHVLSGLLHKMIEDKTSVHLKKIFS